MLRAPEGISRGSSLDDSPRLPHEPGFAGKPNTSGTAQTLAETLDDAEHVLQYAAATGILVDAAVSQAIIAARLSPSTAWIGAEAGVLLAAIAKLAASVQPVTAETLRACRETASKALKGYRRIAVMLALCIVPLSMVSFVNTRISDATTAEINKANDLAVTLRAYFSGPATGTDNVQSSGMPVTSIRPPSEAEVVGTLQQFAAAMRAVYARSHQLNWFVPMMVDDPLTDVRSNPQKRKNLFELTPALPDFRTEAFDKIGTYQDVRYFAGRVQEANSVIYGAVNTYVLPVLYALLGACAFLLRAFSEQVRTRTYAPSYANPARFIMAAIGGAVVGLFGNFSLAQGATLPPLAVAFLVGYAIDVFFSFLDGLLQSFTRSKAP